MKNFLNIAILTMSIILITCTSVEERNEQLKSAVRGDKKDQVDLLVKDGAILTNDTLNLAIFTGNIEMVNHLLNKGIDINGKGSNGKTSLESTFRIGMFNFLLEKGAKIQNPNPILKEGIERQWPSAVIAAIDAGAKVHIYMLYESTFPEIIEVLLKNGANINFKNEDNGRTPLHAHIIKNNPIVTIDFLIQSGANINAKDNDGQTVLHYAANNAEQTQLLLKQKKIDVNIRDEEGSTPLHYVRDEEIAQLLLSKSGINKNPINREGETPYQTIYRIAAGGNHSNYRALLYTLKKAGCR